MAALLRLLFFLIIICSNPIHRGVQASSAASPDIPTATPWPLQFHSLLYVNTSSGALQAIDLWYDWPHGRNFNIIQNQLKNVLHDLEWTNGTSFFYDLDANTCTTMSVDVGILRPDWMDNATYLGQQSIDGFTCNVWSKADFITYYEDVETNRPVHWVFFSGMSIHVMTFEVGAVLEDSEWQAPVYCFSEENQKKATKLLNRFEAGDTLTRWFHALDGYVGVSSHVLNQ